MISICTNRNEFLPLPYDIFLILELDNIYTNQKAEIAMILVLAAIHGKLKGLNTIYSC